MPKINVVFDGLTANLYEAFCPSPLSPEKIHAMFTQSSPSPCPQPTQVKTSEQLHSVVRANEWAGWVVWRHQVVQPGRLLHSWRAAASPTLKYATATTQKQRGKHEKPSSNWTQVVNNLFNRWQYKPLTVDKYPTDVAFGGKLNMLHYEREQTDAKK
jgi:hypothetical protein